MGTRIGQNMEEPPKIRKNKMLERISGKKKSNKSPSDIKKSTPPETLNRYADTEERKERRERLLGRSDTQRFR